MGAGADSGVRRAVQPMGEVCVFAGCPAAGWAGHSPTVFQENEPQDRQGTARLFGGIENDCVDDCARHWDMGPFWVTFISTSSFVSVRGPFWMKSAVALRNELFSRCWSATGEVTDRLASSPARPSVLSGRRSCAVAAGPLLPVTPHWGRSQNHNHN